MNDPLRIFVGSSTEGRNTAQKLVDLLFEIGQNDVTVIPWWEAFPAGIPTIDALRTVMKETDAALLLATQDDQTITRGNTVFTARGNVILECGMSLSAHAHAPGQTVLALLGKVALPSDLDGVTYLPLKHPQRDDFKGRNRAAIEKLVRDWLNSKAAKKNLPAFYEAVLRDVAAYKPETGDRQGLDLMAVSLLDSIAQHLSEDSTKRGITDIVCETSAEHLKTADAIWATDVLGPSSWLTPNAFRYLAIQIREYFRANLIRRRARFRFSPSVGQALRRASDNIKRRTGRESRTKFDDQFSPSKDEPDHNFRWAEGNVGLEFARILLWTEQQLRNGNTESISNIHEAFHVPLFALLVKPDSPVRDFDFIAFRSSDNSVKGFYSNRRDRIPRYIDTWTIPEHGSLVDHWERFFQHPSLMFAVDIHHLLLAGKTVEPML